MLLNGTNTFYLTLYYYNKRGHDWNYKDAIMYLNKLNIMDSDNFNFFLQFASNSFEIISLYSAFFLFCLMTLFVKICFTEIKVDLREIYFDLLNFNFWYYKMFCLCWSIFINFTEISFNFRRTNFIFRSH